jgi:hypothetical protein
MEYLNWSQRVPYVAVVSGDGRVRALEHVVLLDRLNDQVLARDQVHLLVLVCESAEEATSIEHKATRAQGEARRSLFLSAPAATSTETS